MTAITIEIYRQRNRSKTARATEATKDRAATPYNRHKWRWRAKAANGAKVANGGAAYINLDDLIDTIVLLWPVNDNPHISVRHQKRTVELRHIHQLLEAA